MKYESVFFTKSELLWLKGELEISKDYEYKMKCHMRKKLDILMSIDLPLIRKSNLFSKNLTTFSKILTDAGKIHNSTNSLDIDYCAQKRSLGRDLDPGPLPYQGNALPG